MQKACLVLPHQLFEESPLLSAGCVIFLIEDKRFFSDFKFHKKKLIFHRASMQAYKERLQRKHHKVQYIEYDEFKCKEPFREIIKKNKINEIHIIEPSDKEIEKRLEKVCGSLNVRLKFLETPLFITSKSSLAKLLAANKSFSMARFYINQRKKMDVLIKGGKPIGGKWSLDAENRKRLSAGIEIPELPDFGGNRYIDEARRYVLRKFKDNPGSADDFIFPVTDRDAGLWLEDFLEKRLEFFGPYEDAISRQHTFLFHSVLSPLINTGLLNPEEVAAKALDRFSHKKAPLNSIEGFIRQVTGWREFMRGVYLCIGDKQRGSNFWGFQNRLPKSFYDGTTGVEPVDTVIKRVYKNAYCHHIERLMILGNFMLLCEINPDNIYRWFMEMFIDAYDWVMVPNLYGMSQYADGGLITTKPYISSSNYILKMSDFKKGRWCEIWDSLFWRFINKHKSVFAKNPRTGIMTRQLNRMGKSKLRRHIKKSESYLAQLLG